MAKYEVGTSWVLFVMPQWIIGGTVAEDNQDYIVLVDSVYFAGVADTRAAFEIAGATTLAEQLAVSISRYPFEDGVRISKDAIGICSQSALDFKALKEHTEQA
jgi:hypothetical protein